MGVWKLAVEICLPIPFVLLVLLTLPLGRKFHRGVLNLVDKTLGLNFVGTFKLLHVMLAITGAALLASIKATSDISTRKDKNGEDLSPNIAAGQLAKRWRAERNFWISFICFTLWCLLVRFYAILLDKARMEDEYRLLKAQVTGGPPPSAPTRPTPVAAAPASNASVSSASAGTKKAA
ncbi:hypothetical protein WJX72_003954 [[Myrmecia] bisecta]|uniref:BAP29/BAP31 transmembrane domain-containing protein n=1 Tax=[Myrmecia] bisecta TaxID=41462 RepID=A0AAW1PJK3_9CHLO